MQGMIIKQISNLYTVKKEENLYSCGARGRLKQEEEKPVVGDQVEFEVLDKDKKEGIIEGINTRRTFMKRPKIANISQIFFVISIKQPKPDLYLLDKQLVYAEFLKLKPIIVINKIDLLDTYEEIKSLYEKVGYLVIVASAKEEIGIEKIKEQLKNQLSAFSGNSGVGKSSLMNVLLKEQVTQEGEISQKSKKGKNTTTQIQFYEVEPNSFLADTPGFSSFEVSEIKKEELCEYFIEFIPYLGKCEYIRMYASKRRRV